MSKGIIIFILGFVIILVSFIISLDLNNTVGLANSVNNENIEKVGNFVEISDESNENNTELKKTSTSIGGENIRYLIKNVDGYIYIYYLDENNEEFLYKKTSISSDYLSQEDLEDLEIGIEVTGMEELNKRIEDFE